MTMPKGKKAPLRLVEVRLTLKEFDTALKLAVRVGDSVPQFIRRCMISSRPFLDELAKEPYAAKKEK